jgi:DNA-binding MarR family transcriptional regulator
METKPIRRKEPTPAERAYVGIVRVEEWMSHDTNEVLKAHGLSGPQYNVLRILRGAGEEGLPCRKIAERMITRVPDITRLLDRLEAAGNVTRERGAGNDRRVVLTKITAQGLAKVTELDRPIEESHRRQLASLTDAEIESLNALLGKIVEE